MGIASCLPFKYATGKVRTINPTQGGSLAGLFAVAIVASFAILGAGIVICGLVVRDLLIPYAISEILAFIVSVIVFGLVSKRR